MHEWAGGTIAHGLVDEYPLPPEDPMVEIAPGDVKRILGIELTNTQIAEILESLEFEVKSHGSHISAKAPDHRMDITSGVVGKADLLEEIARIYGYDRIPETRMADELPQQKRNQELELEEGLRDILVGLGLQEIITHRLTSPDKENRRLSPGTKTEDMPYFTLSNPISPDKSVLRHSLMASVLEIVERNANIRDRIAVFEIAPVFLKSEENELPDELKRLVIAITGPRAHADWGGADTDPMDFFDLKGIIKQALKRMRIFDVKYEPATYPSFHPGKCARVLVKQNQIGVIGELHPQVVENYNLPETPVLVSTINLDKIFSITPRLFNITPIPTQPPVLEDIALIVDEQIPAVEVENLISQTGGKTVTSVRLFDIYRGEQIGTGKKSLAYSLTYQDPERTLTDKDAAKIRNKIVKRLTNELGARLRGE
jgi:phenylalanyl-tRNA synthetase beta chain